MRLNVGIVRAVAWGIYSIVAFLILLLPLMLLTANKAHALSCFYTGADGIKYYKQVTKTKTLGTVSLVKPCKDKVLLMPYHNNKGMKLYINPFKKADGSIEPNDCYYVVVKDGQLVAYDATRSTGDGSSTYCPTD